MAPSISPETTHNHQAQQMTRLMPKVSNFWQRNAALILGVGLFVCFWMLIYTFFVFKPSYSAKSLVIIKDSAITSRYIEPDQYYALQTTSSSSSNPVLNTMGILKSSAISEAVWQYMKEKHPEHLKKNKIKTQEQWNAFFQDGSAFIKAKNQPGTDLIAVQLSWSEPVLAKETLGVVLTAFQTASRDLNRSEQTTRTQFLERQVKEIETQLTEVRQIKSTYQSTNRTVSMRREGDDLAGSRMELGNKLNLLEAQAQGKERLAHRYQQLLGMSPEKALKASALGQNAAIARQQDELYRLQQQYALLTSSLTETNPKVREIETQIAQVKANLTAEQTRTMGQGKTESGQSVVADGTRGELVRNMLLANGEAQDLRAQAAIIRNRLGQINLDISAFPQKAEGLAQIEQKEASLSLALDHLRQKALEGRLKEAQTLSNVFIVDAPSLPKNAQFPNRSHLIILSLLMGLGVGITTAFAKEQLTGLPQYGLPEWLEPLEKESEKTKAAKEGQGQEIYAQEPVHPLDDSPNPETVALQNENIPFSLAHSIMAEPSSEKVGLPIVGSLFDSLIPVAGPMAHQAPNQSNFRSDLTQSISQPSTQAEVYTHPHPTLTQNLAEAATETAVEKTTSETKEISSPSEENRNPITQNMPVSASVRLAYTPTPSQVAQAQAEHRQKTTPAMDELQGIPVMHVSPQTVDSQHDQTPNDNDDAAYLNRFPLDLSPEGLMPQALQQPITHQPIQYKAPAQVTVQAEPVTPSVTQPQEAKNSLYEQEALKMPLPRRTRGIPAFLLSEDEQQEEQKPSHSQPYTLIPKKQLLSAEDDLSQDVAPLSAPSPAAQASEAIPFPEHLESEAFTPKQPLFSVPRLGKKPHEHPEAYFGINNRKKKRVEPSTSLNRLMAALQEHTNTPKP